MRVMRIVEAVAAFHAEATLVRRAVLAVHEEDLVFLDVVGEQAADAAERAHRVDGLVGLLQADAARRHQRAGRAGLHALAAGDAGRLAHRVVEVEYRHRAVAAVGVADDVVHLHFPAGAHAARALDAGVQVDGNGGVRQIRLYRSSFFETRFADPDALRPVLQLVVERVLLVGHVGEQQLQHQLLRGERARRVGRDFHAGGGIAAARGRQGALALDLDHAGAAIAVGALVAAVAEVRDLDTVLLRRLDDRLVRAPDDRLP